MIEKLVLIIYRILDTILHTRTVSNEFIVDIFGKASTLQFGLVDAENEQEFCSKLASLEEIWNKRESDLQERNLNFFNAHCC